MDRRLTRCKGHTNRKMNDGTYALRRAVMGIVYEAKSLLGGNMPRVSVRITDAHDSRVLGKAYMGGNSIFIPANTVIRDDLRAVVMHEILHAVYSTPHVNKCPLMNPSVMSATHSQVTKLFLKYAKA